MERVILTEVWKRIELGEEVGNRCYEVSNFGRLRTFHNNTAPARYINGSIVQGYRCLNLRLWGSFLSKALYIHRLVAELFVRRESPDHCFVVHKDFEKQNNHFENLQWMTREEMADHNRKNPACINRVRMKKSPTGNSKLTESKVKTIKVLLRNGGIRLSHIARQFGITHTQLNRIRSGENWSHVTID